MERSICSVDVYKAKESRLASAITGHPALTVQLNRLAHIIYRDYSERKYLLYKCKVFLKSFLNSSVITLANTLKITLYNVAFFQKI